MNNDGYSDIIAGQSGEGSISQVRVFLSANGAFSDAYSNQFGAYGTANTEGKVVLDSCDVDNDGADEIIVGQGPNAGNIIRIFEYGSTVQSQQFTAFGSATKAMNIACGDVNKKIQPPPNHVIGVRTVGGNGEFYNTITGKTFTLRGNVFTRFNSVDGHYIFNPGKYDSDLIGTTLQKMRQEGYNSVSVFINPDKVSDPSTAVLSRGYMNNIEDFLNKAKANDMFVSFAFYSMPVGYRTLITPDQNLEPVNNEQYLSSTAFEAKKRFYKDFVRALKDKNAPTEYIFAYTGIEPSYIRIKKPLTMISGLVTTAAGTYDMSSQEQKDKMMDDNLKKYINEMSSAIKMEDPTALFAMGWIGGPNSLPNDPKGRISRPCPAVVNSNVDFIAASFYPHSDGSLLIEEMLGDMELLPGQRCASMLKPRLLNEIGAFKYPQFAFGYSKADAAAGAILELQKDTCQNYGFEAWYTYTWDTITEQPELWHALSENEEINKALAPIYGPNPCSDESDCEMCPGGGVSGSGSGGTSDGGIDDLPSDTFIGAEEPIRQQPTTEGQYESLSDIELTEEPKSDINVEMPLAGQKRSTLIWLVVISIVLVIGAAGITFYVLKNKGLIGKNKVAEKSKKEQTSEPSPFYYPKK